MEQKNEKRHRLYILTSILALTLSTFNLVMAGQITQQNVDDGYMYISADANLDPSDIFFSPQTRPFDMNDEDANTQGAKRMNKGLTGI